MQMVRLTVKASSFPRAWLAYFRLKSKSLYNTSTFTKDKTMPCFPHQPTQQSGHICGKTSCCAFLMLWYLQLESGSLNTVDCSFNLYFWVAIIPANLNTMTCLAEPPILPLSNSLNSKNETRRRVCDLCILWLAFSVVCLHAYRWCSKEFTLTWNEPVWSSLLCMQAYFSDDFFGIAKSKKRTQKSSQVVDWILLCCLVSSHTFSFTLYTSLYDLLWINFVCIQNFEKMQIIYPLITKQCLQITSSGPSLVKMVWTKIVWVKGNM